MDMSQILFLACAFCAIIFVGAVAVFLHDLWERRTNDRWQQRESGRGGAPVFRGVPSFSQGRSAVRGGQVVWVKAGSQPAGVRRSTRTEWTAVKGP